ncbi:MAG: hypothetical protein JW798_10910 [Prolixibacteraceae bacterium]|nr:hypothetical protein [Prolixibacteraceae bacterium]
MIRKLIQLMEGLRIGRKGILFSVLIFCLAGCWEDYHDNYYQVFFRNDTSDTLLLLLGKDSAAYHPLLSYTIIPHHDTTLYWHSITGVNDDEDPVVCIFSGGFAPFEDQARVYRHDSLKVSWVGPAREMPDSIHHFYNYNSWDSWLLEEKQLDGATGIVLFTIYESDLTN